MPQPIAEVKDEEIGGQKFATVTVAVGAGSESSDTVVQLAQSPERQALLLWKSNDLATAERAYQQLIASSSGNPRQKASYLAILAEIQHESGDNATAIQTLNEALSVDPKLPMLKLMQAKAMDESGDLQGEQEALQKYLELDPRNSEVRRLLAKLQQGPQPAGNNPGPSVSAIEPITYSRAIADLSLDQRAPELKNISVAPIKLSGRAPEWTDYVRNDKRAYVRNDQTVIDLQKKRDDLIKIAKQKKEAEAEKQREIKSTPDSNVAAKSALEIQAAQLKADSSQAEKDAESKDKELQNRVKRLIDTHVAEPALLPSNQKTP
jgi:tetratricopeptide (TPR) repeat protein